MKPKKSKPKKCMPCEGTGIQPERKWKQINNPVYCTWCGGDGISIEAKKPRK